LTQIKCYREREVDEGSADTLTHIRGYRSPGYEFYQPNAKPWLAYTAVINVLDGDTRAAFLMSFAPLVGITAKLLCGCWVGPCPAVRPNGQGQRSSTIQRRCGRCSRQCGWPVTNCAANRLKAALPEWLEHYEQHSAGLPEAFKEKLLKISPAQIDRRLRPVRVQHPKKGLSATRPGTLLRHVVADAFGAARHQSTRFSGG